MVCLAGVFINLFILVLWNMRIVHAGKLLGMNLTENCFVKKAVKEKFDMDYRKYIGMQVDVKTLTLRHCIQGVLVAVYSDVLVIQGITCWGVLARDITDFRFEVQKDLFEKESGSIVTPLEGSMGRPTTAERQG